MPFLLPLLELFWLTYLFFLFLFRECLLNLAVGDSNAAVLAKRPEEPIAEHSSSWRWWKTLGVRLNVPVRIRCSLDRARQERGWTVAQQELAEVSNTSSNTIRSYRGILVKLLKEQLVVTPEEWPEHALLHRCKL
ncbi:hypothetical protein Htur_4772 (plasmid) [Haloterrigena turkmenica DSM 5511]|uniref:Uncharacterized protein n=1 Tax=Haloterrigena turkmenica (strain ATCC 51198 / DSM 5511 / JCM 9101 / NCIMB 13204 / VKM B-1734 / 4k) TaxID=543526 RepID=D2S2E7_HALTV|nr:hypothetical protein Htur_4772 [Haloterrigena turkmenica DSM 5511]